jgi:RHS repeat-associated protein
MPYVGRLENRTSYDTFGRVWTSTTPSTEFRFAFTGRDLDPESDLYHYRARYYDPATGQFISADPIGFGAGDGNLYRYVGNGPIDGTDPTGRIEIGMDGEIPGRPTKPLLSETATDPSGEVPWWNPFNLIAEKAVWWTETFSLDIGLQRDLNVAKQRMAWNSARVPNEECVYDLRDGQQLGETGHEAIGRVLEMPIETAETIVAVGDTALLIYGGARTIRWGAVQLVGRRGGPSFLRGSTTFWDDIAGEWRGWGEGFADTGRFRWAGSSGMRARYGQTNGVRPFDAIHHRIFSQGGTRGGAGQLSLQGLFREQYGRYIPNFIKNTRWNTRNLGQPLSRGGSGLHEALHGTNRFWRMNALQRVWYGTNTYDKVAIVVVSGGIAYVISE